MAPKHVDRDEIRALLVTASELVRLLKHRAGAPITYLRGLGIRLTYHPARRHVLVESTLAEGQHRTRYSIDYTGG